MIKRLKRFIATNKNIVFFVSIIIAIAIAATLVFVLIAPTVNNGIRQGRIITIFNSLKLDNDKYIIQFESIFGDKQVYEWDSSRSYSSSKQYIRYANADITIAEIKKAVANTYFVFYEEPYPNAATFMYIYKSPKNEYLRISVSSKAREDAYFNKYHMGLSTDSISVSPNNGPSRVTIKVNLDDNNE